MTGLLDNPKNSSTDLDDRFVRNESRKERGLHLWSKHGFSLGKAVTRVMKTMNQMIPFIKYLKYKPTYSNDNKVEAFIYYNKEKKNVACNVGNDLII